MGRMEERKLMEAHVQAKRMNNLLNEIMDVSKQLAEAVDRDDHVSIQMLLAMRQGPINQAKEVDMTLKQQCDEMGDPEDGRRLAELLKGGAAETPEEAPLAAQIAANARLLRQVVEQDKILSEKLTRGKSVYGKG